METLAEQIEEWRLQQPDMIEDGKCGIIMRLSVCREYLKSARHHWQKSEGSGWRDEYRQEGWAEGFVLCQGCPHYIAMKNPHRIDKRLAGKPSRLTAHGVARRKADYSRRMNGSRAQREAVLTTPHPRFG